MYEQIGYVDYDDQIQYQVMFCIVQNIVYVVGVVVCVFFEYVVKLVEEVFFIFFVIVFGNWFQYGGIKSWSQD